ncbi:deoxyribose-phosphate aldolase [Halodesulfurarchaeum sp. HSR-GB]|uniref:deoxyribose-phosphate aldolase n=1 Tax=Halodesulfurarchaeum sp. HSR-GB TaxID=3074077 RepID=UPI00285D37CA|nr:deoxyribose-phosphate aldolase [Halodesulfurarchaeum sp. HSR-GB]MDR5656352.1 deoxyribose-phosphate aldolase [Halodesulfurarchaeum sp. HSR-GB]
MKQDELAGHIDHTVLGPETTMADVRQVIEEAEAWGMNVCIPPCYVAEARDLAEAETTIATVIGFPHGQHDPAIKREEAVRAVEAGADELDVVLNVGRLQAGETDAVRDELAAIVEAVSVPVKVIVEAPLLSEAEKHAAGEAAVAAGVDFLKTATGFGGGGATVEDVELLAEYRPVKASGGIGSYEAAMAMLEAGAERIGASSGVEILSGAPE